MAETFMELTMCKYTYSMISLNLRRVTKSRDANIVLKKSRIKISNHTAVSYQVKDITRHQVHT